VDQGPDLIRDLLILEARGATGQLEVISAGVHTLLYFVDGQLVYAEGGTLTDTLGRVLTRAGALTQQQYVAILQRMTDKLVEHEEMRFGEVAIGLGYLTPQDVTEGLARQVRSRLMGCLQHEQCIRYFDEGSSYTGRVPRFPVELGAALMSGLHAFYDEERLFPLLMLSLERRWRLRDATDWGAARFSFSGEELQVARQLIEPARLAELIGEPPSALGMRVVMLLWLAGLVEDCEPRGAAADRPRSDRPSIDRDLREDLSDRALPSMRPGAPEAHAPAEPTAPAPLGAPAEPAAPAALGARPEVAERSAAELASARARVLKGLQGVTGGRRAGAGTSAAAAIAALRDRRNASSPAIPAAGAGAAEGVDPRVEAESCFQRGRSDLDQGRAAAARQQFDAAFRWHPSDEYALYLEWARFLSAAPADVALRRATVEERMMVCLRADRRMAFGHYVAGRLALLDDEYEAAAKSFKRAVMLDPDLNDAARSLRLAQQRLGGKKS
jgi:tetratricopeptide (TPR) repeat protein